MLTFSRFVNEVAEPASKGDRDFKKNHEFVKNTKLADNSTDDDKLFNASNVTKTKRHADRESNDHDKKEYEKFNGGVSEAVVEEEVTEVIEDSEVVDPNSMATDATEFSDPKPEIAVAAAKMPEEELKKVLKTEEKKYVSMSSTIRNVLGK